MTKILVETFIYKVIVYKDRVEVVFNFCKRYNDCKATYSLLRNTSDRLCREYGLSVIESPERGKKRSYDAWQAECEGKPTWWSIVRNDVDTAVKQSMSIQAFILCLKALGYEIKSGKYPAIRPEGKERFVRLKTLGENYSEDAIKYRILAQQCPEYPPKPARFEIKHVRYKGDFNLIKPTIKGLRALYLYYLYLLRKAQKQAHTTGFFFASRGYP